MAELPSQHLKKPLLMKKSLLYLQELLMQPKTRPEKADKTELNFKPPIKKKLVLSPQ